MTATLDDVTKKSKREPTAEERAAEEMVRRGRGERTVEYLVGKGRLESFEAEAFGAVADALQLVTCQGEFEQWPARDGVVEGSGAPVQPSGVADGDLDGPCQAVLGGAEGGVKLVAVWFAEDQHVDISDGSLPSLSFVPGGPGPVNVGRDDPRYGLQGFGEHGGNAEGPGQHLRQSRVIGTCGVRADEPGAADLPAGDQAGLFGALDLPVDRWMRRAGPCCDVGEAEFEIGIAEQQGEDLALLLGAQDRQKRRRRLFVHKQKNTLQFADTCPGRAHRWRSVANLPRASLPGASPDRE